MSGRIFQKLRDEMGVAYYCRASTDTMTDHGVFSVSAGVTTAKLSESIDALLGELARLRSEAVPERELRKAKDYLIGTMYLHLESSDDVANFAAEQEILRRKIITPEELSEKIERVTADDVRQVAKEIFVDKNLNMALIGKTLDEKGLLKQLKF